MREPSMVQVWLTGCSENEQRSCLFSLRGKTSSGEPENVTKHAQITVSPVSILTLVKVNISKGVIRNNMNSNGTFYSLT